MEYANKSAYQPPQLGVAIPLRSIASRLCGAVAVLLHCQTQLNDVLIAFGAGLNSGAI